MKQHPDNPFDCQPGFHVYKVYEKPPVERAKPIIDQIHLDWYKLQNLKAKAKGDTIGIDIDSLIDAVPDGRGGFFQPVEVVKKYEGGEVLLFKGRSTDDYGLQQNLPIREIKGGMGPIYEQFIGDLSFQLDFLRRNLGISEGLDASTPEARQSVRNTYLAAEGTKTALKTHRRGVKNIYKKLVEGIAVHIQDYIRYSGEMTVYQYGIGEEALTPFVISEGVTSKMYGFIIEEEPDPQEVELILTAASQAKQQRDAAGVGGIDTSDFFDIKRFLDKGRTKQAIARLKLAKARAERLDQQKMLLNQQQQAAIQQQVAQASEQAAQQTLMLKEQLEEKKFAREVEKEERMIRLKHQLEMEKIDRELGIKKQLDQDMLDKKAEQAKELETHKASLAETEV